MLPAAFGPIAAVTNRCENRLKAAVLSRLKCYIPTSAFVRYRRTISPSGRKFPLPVDQDLYGAFQHEIQGEGAATE